jgi:hypothetical protein
MFKIVAAIVLLSVSTLASSDDAESGDDQYRQILQKSILRKNGDVEVSGDSAEAARLINLFDRYSPQKVVVIPPTTLIQDHM